MAFTGSVAQTTSDHHTGRPGGLSDEGAELHTHTHTSRKKKKKKIKRKTMFDERCKVGLLESDDVTGVEHVSVWAS